MSLSDGRTFMVEANAPPSEADVMAHLGGQAQPKPVAATAEPEPFRPPPAMGQMPWMRDMNDGLRSSLARTMYGGGDVVRRAWNAVAPDAVDVDRVIDRPDVQATMTPPATAVGRAASATGDIAQFFTPAGGVGKVRAALEVGKAAALTGAQGGGTGDVATAAALSAVIPGAGAVRAAGKKLEAAAEPLVRAALKPTVASLRRIAGATGEGLDAKANALVRFIIDNRLTTGDKARKLFQDAEHELQRVLNVKNAPTDAAVRAGRYIDALTKSAAKQGLGGDDVAQLRKAADELIAGPMGEDWGFDAAGNVIRRLRADVPAADALASARASSRWSTRKAWGEQKGAQMEAQKAVERAQRDAVKTAVPEARALLATEAKSIQAAEALDRMAQRAANRDAVSLPAHVIAAGELATGRAPVLAFAANWLRNNQMKAGMWADVLGKAIQKGNAPLAADILKRLGVGVAVESMKGAPVPSPIAAGATR